MPKRKIKRLGFTMIELLVVVAILVILAAVAIGVATSSQEKARKYRAQSELQNYVDAFTSAVASYPGLVNTRAAAWSDEASYTGLVGLKELVKGMNIFLSDDLDMYWDPEDLCYKSTGTDPWGDHYVLTEYPILEGTENYFDPTVAGNESRACISIWSLVGHDWSALGEELSKDLIGVGIMQHDGIMDDRWHGLNGDTSFEGYTLKMQ